MRVLFAIGLLVIAADIVASISLADAAVYNCDAIYERSSAQNRSSETMSGVFDTESEESEMVLNFQSQFNRHAALYANKDSTIALQIGDFCGEIFSTATLPHDLGPTFKYFLSFGRNPDPEVWESLTLQCTRRP